MYFFGADEHLLAITASIDAALHQHTFLQLTIGLEQPVTMEISGKRTVASALLLGSNISHSLSGGPALLLLVDQASALGGMLRRHLGGQPMRVFAAAHAAEAGRYAAAHYQHIRGHEDYVPFLAELLQRLQLAYDAPRPIDERIAATLERLRHCRHSEHPLGELAQLAGLSRGRLSHLFKEQTGIALGSYLVMNRNIRRIREADREADRG